LSWLRFSHREYNTKATTTIPNKIHVSVPIVFSSDWDYITYFIKKSSGFLIENRLDLEPYYWSLCKLTFHCWNLCHGCGEKLVRAKI
jgi:hypothetical protein